MIGEVQAPSKEYVEFFRKAVADALVEAGYIQSQLDAANPGWKGSPLFEDDVRAIYDATRRIERKAKEACMLAGIPVVTG